MVTMVKMAWNSCYKTDTIHDLDIHVIETMILPLLGNYYAISTYHVIKVLSFHRSVAAQY